ncbi:MAG: RagB/SusD family nutrient uptake outer membrane protein, partial [Chitinophagaceae bacterium]
GLTQIVPHPDQLNAWDNAKGSALFYRAFSFYQLAQVFAPPFQKSSSTTDLGIPLRMQADVNEKIHRATLQQTYDQIISDLQAAQPLLPVTPLYKTRPSKPAVFALLARVYQTMQNYGQAFLYSDSCLQLDPTLMDYNSLDSSATYPIQRFNPEVIFENTIISNLILNIAFGRIDSTLYQSFSGNDLRKSIFFETLDTLGGHEFRGTYSGTPGYFFAGLATDEMYLIRAECFARMGNVPAAMNDLNTLLQ